MQSAPTAAAIAGLASHGLAIKLTGIQVVDGIVGLTLPLSLVLMHRWM